MHPRCITGFGIFYSATSQNTVAVLRKAIKSFGTPGQILSDNGAQFTSRNRGVPAKGWKSALFEEEALERGIILINSRPHHPQTNGKIERFFRTLEDELVHFKTVGEFIDFYNEDRLHFSLDIENCQVPLMAFKAKKVPDAIRKSNQKWMEVDMND